VGTIGRSTEPRILCGADDSIAHWITRCAEHDLFDAHIAGPGGELSAWRGFRAAARHADGCAPQRQRRDQSGRRSAINAGTGRGDFKLDAKFSGDKCSAVAAIAAGVASRSAECSARTEDVRFHTKQPTADSGQSVAQLAKVDWRRAGSEWPDGLHDADDAAGCDALSVAVADCKNHRRADAGGRSAECG
jgi:hypothetical protein